MRSGDRNAGGGGKAGAGTGQWQALTLGTSMISTASGGWAPAAARSESYGNVVRLRGRIEPTGAVANGDVLATLPVGLRPVAPWSGPGRWSGGTAVLTVGIDGTIRLANALSAGQWVTLDPVSFPLT